MQRRVARPGPALFCAQFCVLFCVLALAAAGCGGASAPGQPRIVGVGFGVTFSPRGFTTTMTEGDIRAFYRDHAETGPIVAFHMSWRDSVEAAGQVPATAVGAQMAANEYGFHLVVGFGWYTPGAGAHLDSTGEPGNNSWTNAESRAAFVAMLRSYAARYRPQFLFIGNEVNTYYLAVEQAEWDAWVSAYREAYDAIKAESPDTTVFITFQLEHLRGIGAKTGFNGPPQWEILDDFAGSIDAMGFTSYPYFEYETPADMPADYYAEIAQHWGGPVIFTEIGWLADPAAPYTGSLQEHVDYIDRFFDLTETLDLGYVTYFLLHDLDVAPLGFREIGLRTNDGTPRASLARWQARIAERNG